MLIKIIIKSRNVSATSLCYGEDGMQTESCNEDGYHSYNLETIRVLLSVIFMKKAKDYIPVYSSPNYLCVMMIILKEL